jgi:hypothetical protein
MEAAQILRKQLGELGFSKDFMTASTAMQFSTLEDILAETSTALLAREGFNYRWFAELVEFLSARQLLHLLQPLPGSNAY